MISGGNINEVNVKTLISRYNQNTIVHMTDCITIRIENDVMTRIGGDDIKYQCRIVILAQGFDAESHKESLCQNYQGIY